MSNTNPAVPDYGKVDLLHVGNVLDLVDVESDRLSGV